MIKAIILAAIAATSVPFMAEHRVVSPSTVVSTNLYGSVTGIVDRAYIESHGGGGGGGDVTTQQATNIAQNVVREDVRTNYLCTVAAAQAMTNNATIVRGTRDENEGFWKIYVENADSASNATLAEDALTAHSVEWSNVESTPESIEGYGITDAYTKAEVNAMTNDTFVAATNFAYTASLANLDSPTLHGYRSLTNMAVYTYDPGGIFGFVYSCPERPSLASALQAFGQPIYHPNADYWGFFPAADDVDGCMYADNVKPSSQSATTITLIFLDNVTYDSYDVIATRGIITPHIVKDSDMLATTSQIHSVRTASDYVSNRVATVESTVSDWETYWRGDRVRLSVTNYYGNTSGELPRLRIEEFDHSITTVVGNVQIVSNFFHTVWDEDDRHTNYMATTDAKVNTISNNVLDAAWRQTNLQLVNKAPRAWQTVTSAGEDAPPNMVWHTAPQSVFAGGTEYAHVAVGEGSICILVDKGAPVYTDGAEGQFRFQDQSGQNYFGFDVRSAYKIGCRTDGISVNPQAHIVSLTYDLTSSTNPSIIQSTNLVDWVDAEVEWEQNPPEGTKICYINCGTNPRGFYQAEIRYAGGSKFLTNMQADLMGGIAASNEVLQVTQSIYPTITSTGIVWRVLQ